MTTANIPNYFTLLRIVLIPIFVLVFYIPGVYSNYIVAGIFAFAAITDWLDGFLARLMKQTSSFGAFLDPVADKLLVASALMLIAVEFNSIWITVPAIVIVCREIAISALREWMAEVGERSSVAVNFLGKLKTFIQLVAITVLLSQPASWDSHWVWGGVTLMYFSAILTVWSMWNYLKDAWFTLR